MALQLDSSPWQRWLRFMSIVVFIHKGEIIQTGGNMEDIVERKNSNENTGWRKAPHTLHQFYITFLFCC